jgi:hypothetical protein
LLEIPRSLPEGVVIAVPKRFSKVFEKKQEKSVHHLARMANALSTNDLSKESGLLVVDNEASRTLAKSLMNMSTILRETGPI